MVLTFDGHSEALEEKQEKEKTIEELKDTVANLSDGYVKLIEEFRRMKNDPRP
jgi:hypothetical protein